MKLAWLIRILVMSPEKRNEVMIDGECKARLECLMQASTKQSHNLGKKIFSVACTLCSIVVQKEQ